MSAVVAAACCCVREPAPQEPVYFLIEPSICPSAYTKAHKRAEGGPPNGFVARFTPTELDKFYNDGYGEGYQWTRNGQFWTLGEYLGTLEELPSGTFVRVAVETRALNADVINDALECANDPDCDGNLPCSGGAIFGFSLDYSIWNCRVTGAAYAPAPEPEFSFVLQFGSQTLAAHLVSQLYGDGVAIIDNVEVGSWGSLPGGGYEYDLAEAVTLDFATDSDSYDIVTYSDQPNQNGACGTSFNCYQIQSTDTYNWPRWSTVALTDGGLYAPEPNNSLNSVCYTQTAEEPLSRCFPTTPAFGCLDDSTVLEFCMTNGSPGFPPLETVCVSTIDAEVIGPNNFCAVCQGRLTRQIIGGQNAEVATCPRFRPAFSARMKTINYSRPPPGSFFENPPVNLGPGIFGCPGAGDNVGVVTYTNERYLGFDSCSFLNGVISTYDPGCCPAIYVRADGTSYPNNIGQTLGGNPGVNGNPWFTAALPNDLGCNGINSMACLQFYAGVINVRK